MPTNPQVPSIGSSRPATRTSMAAPSAQVRPTGSPWSAMLGGAGAASGASAITGGGFPDLLADAVQRGSTLPGLWNQDVETNGETLPALASRGLTGSSNPLSGSTGFSGALSGLANLFGVAGTDRNAQIAPAVRAAGEKSVETALGYLGRYDWNNYCERFVEVCYGTQNLYPNAATAGRALVTHRGMSALSSAPVGAILYFAANNGNQQQGHAALNLGDGRMISATPSGVKIEKIDSPAYSGQFVGWAEPGSFSQGRAQPVPRGAEMNTADYARTTATSRIGSVVPPSVPRASTPSSRAVSAAPSTSASTASAPGVRPRVSSSAVPDQASLTSQSAVTTPAVATAPLRALRPNSPSGPAESTQPLTAGGVASRLQPPRAAQPANSIGLGRPSPLAPLGSTTSGTTSRRA